MNDWNALIKTVHRAFAYREGMAGRDSQGPACHPGSKGRDATDGLA